MSSRPLVRTALLFAAFPCALLALPAGCSPSSGGSRGRASAPTDGGPSKTSDTGTTGAPDAGADAPLTSGNPTGLWVDGMFAYPIVAPDAGAPALDDECPSPSNGASSTPSAFDGSGDLWVQVAGDSTISVIMWSAAQLSAACSSGQPTRTVTVMPSGQTPGEISAMAFDPSGTLWLSMPDEDLIFGLSKA